MAKIGDLTVKLNVNVKKQTKVSDVYEGLRPLEDFLSKEIGVAYGGVEARMRIEAIDHHYEDVYSRDAMKISMRLVGYVMPKKKSRAVGKARIGTPYECGVCMAPPGVPCTPSCDDDRVPDHEVEQYKLKVWSDDEERRRYGRDLERGQASTTAKAPRARRFGPVRKDGVAVEDVATLADLLCEEVEP